MRLDYLDVMKAMAIIAVVLYHTGYMTYGYLGVDVFLVINGYLLAKESYDVTVSSDICSAACPAVCQ